MLPILIATVLWALAAIGLGSRLLRSEDLRGEDPELSVALLGFAGLLVMAAVGLWANIVAPVGPLVSFATLAAGLLPLRATLRVVRAAPRSSLVVLLACLLLSSSFGQIPGLYGDQGLYYVQAVEWAKSSRAPLGLVNLHGRLGFNSSWFLVAAVMELPGLHGKSSFPLSTLPILFGTAAMLGGVARLRRGEWTLDAILLASTVVPLSYATVTLASMSPDGAIWVVTFLAIALWSRAFARSSAFGASAVFASLLSVFAVTIKLSALPLAFLSLVLLAWFRSMLDRAAVRWFLAVSAVLVVPWLVRGVMTSGCALYPAPATCVESLPWSSTKADAALMHGWIASWARTPGAKPAQVLGNMRWLAPWALRMLRDPAALAVLLFFTAGVVGARRRHATLGAAFWIPMGLCTAGALFWFATAPDPRFALGVLLALALLPVSAAVWHRANEGSPAEQARFRRRLPLVTAGACILLVGALNLQNVVVISRSGLALAAWPPFPRPEATKQMTVSGAVVNTPVGTAMCWHLPLPCAPPPSDLAFRGPFAPADPPRASIGAATTGGDTR